MLLILAAGLGMGGSSVAVVVINAPLVTDSLAFVYTQTDDLNFAYTQADDLNFAYTQADVIDFVEG